MTVVLQIMKPLIGGYMQYDTMSSTELTDINWGYIEYDEFTTSSYTDIDWGHMPNLASLKVQVIPL